MGKNYIEQHVYDKKHVPAPGKNQPKHGFSSLTKSGGGFSKSKSKNYIEQAVYEKEFLPDPGANQPKHGKFTGSIARRTSMTYQPSAGKWGKHKSKNWVHQHTHDKNHVPGPGKHLGHDH